LYRAFKTSQVTKFGIRAVPLLLHLNNLQLYNSVSPCTSFSIQGCMMPHPCASSHLQHVVGICSLKGQVLHAPVAEDNVLSACWTYVCTFVVPCDKGSMVHTVSQDVCKHFSTLHGHLTHPTKTFLSIQHLLFVTSGYYVFMHRGTYLCGFSLASLTTKPITRAVVNLFM